MRRRPLLLALSLALALSGCDDLLAPTEVAGTYVLTAPVPAVAVGALYQRLIADTIIVRADGTASRRGTIEQTLTGTGPGTLIPREWAYTYRLEDGAIGLLWQCPINAACVAMAMREWYDVTGNAVALRARDGSGAVYRRVEFSPP